MFSINAIKSLKEQCPDFAKCYGITSFSTIGECNASRGMMAANNVKQTMVLLNPEPAKVLSGSENTFGKLSSGYKFLSGEWKVLDKIKKYSDGEIYTLILYQESTNTVDIIEKQYAEDGPERFGYVYNTSAMDSHEVGDTIKDEVIYKSTSYDENMNYCMGINARTACLTGVSTFEDGVVISKKFAEKVKTAEVTSFNVSINDNDVPLLIHEYDGARHSIPRIGQHFKGSNVIATRKINHRKIAFDFTNEAVTKITPNDSRYKAGKNSIIYDMDIFFNGKGEFPNNTFFKELHDYYVEQCAYYEKIYEWGQKIKEAGYNRTSNTQIMTKSAKDFLDVANGEYKWKDKERAFSNIIVRFKCISILSLFEGFKLVGRYGDKGVISEIRGKDSDEHYVPDNSVDKLVAKMLGIEYSPKLKISVAESHMMYDSKGREVDIYINASGAFRRENTGQLSEIDLNFIAEKIQDRIKELPTVKEKFDLAMDFIEDLSEYQLNAYLDHYKIELNPKAKSRYKASPSVMKKITESIEKDGFYIFKTPHTDLRYDKICKLYDKYPWIERETMYIDKFGMEKLPVVTPMVIGYKYWLVLKQTSNKNFSARSIGRVNKIGCPTKSTDKKENRTNISDTPINRGETYNLFAALDSTTLMTSDIYTRCSPIARRDLKQILTQPLDPLNVKKWKFKKTYTNVNALNLQARFKTLGIGYRFVTNKSLASENLRNYKSFMDIYEYKFFDYGYNEMYYNFIVRMYKDIMRKGTAEEKNDVWNVILKSEEYEYVNPPKDIFATVMSTIMASDEDLTEELDTNEEEMIVEDISASVAG